MDVKRTPKPKLRPIWRCESCNHYEPRDEPIIVNGNAGKRAQCPYCRIPRKAGHGAKDGLPMARAVR